MIKKPIQDIINDESELKHVALTGVVGSAFAAAAMYFFGFYTEEAGVINWEGIAVMFVLIVIFSFILRVAEEVIKNLNSEEE